MYSTDLYTNNELLWPQEGRHILAHQKENSLIVYQAYRPEIGHYAAENQKFGGPFSFSRMSWIKPNFLWMMYRSGWETKAGQEVTLAIEISKSFFNEILRCSVSSTYCSERYTTQENWKEAGKNSDVRLQWDPDHSPTGEPLARNAIQLGLRGEILHRFATSEALSIKDVSEFVEEQRPKAIGCSPLLRTPTESVYNPHSSEAESQIGLHKSSSK
ncbi:DUF4291 domain-containing protein [Roseibacillus persicicus]|uniref:DUF4291 domain-containing protein n=1 Tax=Roseibacillus persicicus TaxID=454148 RepID=UPI00398A8D5A